MTLKEVEAASGFSATHISEIGRGRTSPTIGALVKIATALGRDPNYFIDDRERDVVSFVSGKDNAPLVGDGGKGGLRNLTEGVVGGRLESNEVLLSPGQSIKFEPHFGEECGLVLAGSVEIQVGGEAQRLGPLDAFHYVSRESHAIRNVGGGDARLVLVGNRNSLI